MSCYVASPRFAATRIAATAKAREINSLTKGNNPKDGMEIPCLECAVLVYRKPSQVGKRKFCSSLCYRRYFSKRFDRHIANPETLALPQNYDEFLSGDLLNCLIEGCTWKGHHLSMHVNYAHGIEAKAFKRMGGFNLHSGIISAPLQEAYSQRPNMGIALSSYDRTDMAAGVPTHERYRSHEAAEHARKARLLKSAGEHGPPRLCRGCGKDFVQNNPFGATYFCGAACRNDWYRERARAREHELTCSVCGAPFLGCDEQRRRQMRGNIVVCSMHCRQVRASRIARGTWTEA